MEIINWKIAAHPMNWIIIFLIVFITAIGVHAAFGRSLPGPSTQNP